MIFSDYQYYILFFQLLFIYPTKANISHNLNSSLKQIDIIHVAQKIIKNCLGRRKSTVFLNDRNENNFLPFHRQFSFSTTLFSFESNDNDILSKYKRFQNIYTLNQKHFTRTDLPASSVIVQASRLTNLSMILETFRDSIWWNSKAHYLIVNIKDEEGCLVAASFLSIVWHFNILSALYLCMNTNNALFLYTFNPYANLAPQIWKNVKTSQVSNQYWSLFKYAVNKSEELFVKNSIESLQCHNLYFDKTTDLNGYTLKAVYWHDTIESFYNKTEIGYQRCVSGYFRLFCTLMSSINATIDTKQSSIYGHVQVNEPRGTVKDVFSGIADLAMHPFFIRDYFRYQTYPFDSMGIVVTSYKNSNAFYLVRIFFLELKCFVCIALYILATLIVLMYVLGIFLSSALIQLFKVIFDGSHYISIQESQLRIVLSAYVVIVYTTLTFMQSDLSAIRTAPEEGFLINSFDDLIQSDFSLYGPQRFTEFLWQKEILDRYQIANYTECLDKISKGYCASCLSALLTTQYYTCETNYCHLSKSIAERSISFLFSKDLPIAFKLNWMIFRLAEAGISQFYLSQDEHKYRKCNKEDENFPYRIEHFIVNLPVLFGGLSLATICLLLEIVTNKLQHLN